MRRALLDFACVSSLWLFTGTHSARAVVPPAQLVDQGEADIVGSTEGTAPVAKALEDTIWIADWSFDASCDASGWTTKDLRAPFDGSNYWCISSAYHDSGGPGNIVNKAAVLRKHDLCFSQDGYGNLWDYSIILKYRGGVATGGTQPTLSFKFISDSELNFDYVTVECDSLGLSESLVDFTLNPKTSGPQDFRDQVFSTTGLNNPGVIAAPLTLIDYTRNDPTKTHEAYIRFVSDGAYSDEDGVYPTYWHAGIIVDNIAVGGTLAYSEDFEAASGCATTPTGGGIAGLNSNVTLHNTQPAKHFAIDPSSPSPWARIFRHITDNDPCTENTTCAWLQTDPTRPRFFADMGFAPGGVVIRNWLDELIVSPWVSLASTSSAAVTLLHWRQFPGNNYSQSRIVQGWRVRGLLRVNNTDTPIPGDSVYCITPWGHTTSFNLLSVFSWISNFADLTPYFDRRSIHVQVGFRLTDVQFWFDPAIPITLNTGPGPFIDRVRVGRRAVTGPSISEGVDSRSQAQDAFGAYTNAIPGGEHHSPATGANDRHQGVPFDQGADLTIHNRSPNLVTGDSIHVAVQSLRPGGNDIASVKLYAAFKSYPNGPEMSSPHAGKFPAGSAYGSSGFFAVNADSCRNPSGVAIADNWVLDLPDAYMRGGDELVYFWWARDNGGGGASDPNGIPPLPNGDPDVTSIADAEAKTGGLMAMSALPAINWAPSYLAAIASSPDGNMAPTQAQIDASPQRNCILYNNNQAAARRRSSDQQRTSFMYTLDRLGYKGHYDVYDQYGTGNSNNQLGGRATVAQARGYALIVHDSGHAASQTMTNGVNLDAEKIDQAGWYRSYLANGLTSEIGTATLWVLGDNVVENRGSNTLFGTDMGVALGNVNNGAGSVNPDVMGKASFTFQSGVTRDFTADRFALAGGCPSIRNYDGLNLTSGTGTHKYATGAAESAFWAIVMNKNTSSRWNTILSAFSWADISDAFCPDPAGPCPNPGRTQEGLLGRVLAGVLPVDCQRGESPTGVPDELDVPRRTALHQNQPNPFNPTTTIRFDLARDAWVELQIFDVSGRRVRGLENRKLQAAYSHRVLWDGLDDTGWRVSSGVYLYRLVAGDFSATRKMIVLK